uniref:Uncharacterized protein n=1 Tax=Megaviridae environmental sample TaxID=1737588 RepID=A0A5J6VI80_9VIRU|nr:MAG: hypothetical protein [Megaviridae environmental sample]
MDELKEILGEPSYDITLGMIITWIKQRIAFVSPKERPRILKAIIKLGYTQAIPTVLAHIDDCSCMWEYIAGSNNINMMEHMFALNMHIRHPPKNNIHILVAFTARFQPFICRMYNEFSDSYNVDFGHLCAYNSCYEVLSHLYKCGIKPIITKKDLLLMLGDNKLPADILDTILKQYASYKDVSQVAFLSSSIFERLINILMEKTNSDIMHIVNKQNDNGNTALHMICICGVHGMHHIKCLLKCGANPNIRNNMGETPLHIFTQNHQDLNTRDDALTIVKMLVRGGCNPLALDNNQCSALEYVSILPSPSQRYLQDQANDEYRQIVKIALWIRDKLRGYKMRVCAFIAFHVREWWWNPDNPCTVKLRRAAFESNKVNTWIG